MSRKVIRTKGHLTRLLGWLSKAVPTDGLRPVMELVQVEAFNDGVEKRRMVAADGFVLHVLELPFGEDDGGQLQDTYIELEPGNWRFALPARLAGDQINEFVEEQTLAPLDWRQVFKPEVFDKGPDISISINPILLRQVMSGITTAQGAALQFHFYGKDKPVLIEYDISDDRKGSARRMAVLMPMHYPSSKTPGMPWRPDQEANREIDAWLGGLGLDAL